jgi:hypothetical protein
MGIDVKPMNGAARGLDNVAGYYERSHSSIFDFRFSILDWGREE